MKSKLHLGGWGLFISILTFIHICEPIGNNHDNSSLYLIELVIPALIALALTILLQIFIVPRALLVLLQTATAFLLFWMGFVSNSFELYNGDNVLFIGGYIIIYHQTLFQIFLATLFPLIYLQSIIFIQNLSQTDGKPKNFFAVFEMQIFGQAWRILSFLIIIKYMSLGMGFYFWGISQSIDIISWISSPISGMPQMFKIKKEKSYPQPSGLKVFTLFLFNILCGFFLTIDFLRYGTNTEGKNYTLFFEMNPRTVLDESIVMLILFIAVAFIGKPYLKRVWSKQRVSPKNLHHFLVVLLCLSWLLFITQNLGIAPYFIPPSSILLPWIYIVMGLWTFVPYIWNHRVQPIRVGITLLLNLFAIWGGQILAYDPDEIRTGWVMGVILGVITILGIITELKVTKARKIHQKRNSLLKNTNLLEKTAAIFETFARQFRTKKILPTMSIAIIILISTIFSVAHINSASNFQILANVDENCIFYLSDPMARVDKDFKPNLGLSRYKNLNNTIHISSARNEYESVQMVMLPINQKHFSLYDLSFSGFTHKEDASNINSSNFESYIVEYIEALSDVVADRLIPFHPLTVADGKNHPLWLTFYIPENASAGTYSGEITLHVDDKWDPLDWYHIQEKTIHIELEVFNFTLPQAPSLKSNFGLYEDDYSDKLWQKFPEYRMMRWSVLKSPPCTLNFDGSIAEINFTAFNAAVLENFQHYTHSLGIHSSNFAYILPAGDFQVDGQFYNALTYPSSVHYNATITEYFGLFEQYLKAQWYIDEYGRNVTWFDEFYISGHDEIQGRGEEVTREALKEYRWLKERIGVSLPIMQTGAEPDREPSMYELIDIICFHSTGSEPDYITDWKSRGKEVWFYTTRGPRFPSPSASTSGMATQLRALGWQCFVYNYSNYLIWDIKTPPNGRSGYAYQGWNGGSLLYPVSDGYTVSARLENIRDGFEDYEYFYLLDRYIRSEAGSGTEELEVAHNLRLMTEGLFEGFSPDMDYRKFHELRGDIGEFLGRIENV